MKKKIAFALIMGIASTCVISFMLIAVNIGFTDIFLKVWLRSWALAYMAVIPSILLIGPVVERLVNRMFKEKELEEETV